MNRSLCLALLLALASCAAPPRYSVRFTEEGPDVAVRSFSAEDAVHLAGVVDRDHAYLLEHVPGTRPQPLEVWRLDDAGGERLERLGADGLTAHRDAASVLAVLAPRWWGATRVLLLDRAEDRVVTHELVHALLGPGWDPLPAALEEGLCDWLSFERHPFHRGPLGHLNCLTGRELLGGLDVRIRSGRGRGDGFGLRWTRSLELREERLADLAQVLDLPERTPWPGLAAHEVSYAYASGWLLAKLAVERHGLEGLLAACEEARAEGRGQLAPQEVLDLAGLRSAGFDPAHLRTAQVEAFRQAALSEPELEQSLLELYFEHARSGESAHAFLDRAGGRLRIEGEAPVDWQLLPGFADLRARLSASVSRSQRPSIRRLTVFGAVGPTTDIAKALR